MRRSLVMGVAVGAALAVAGPHFPSVGQYYQQHALNLTASGVPFVGGLDCILGPAVLRATDASAPRHSLVGVSTYRVSSPSGAFVTSWTDGGDGGFVALAVNFSLSCQLVTVEAVGVFADGHTAPGSLTYRHRL